MIRPLCCAAPLAALALAAVPAAAGAATVAVPACTATVPGQPTLPIQGGGYAPNSFITLAADGAAFGSAQTDALGNFTTTLNAPTLSSINRTRQTFQLTATDAAGTPATTAMVITRVGAKIPERARPGSKVRYEVFGFRPGSTLYLHIRRGGKTRGSFRVGKAQAPCGTATRRMRYMPLKRYSTGVYDYYFQASKRYNGKAPRVRLRIQITRRITFG